MHNSIVKIIYIYFYNYTFFYPEKKHMYTKHMFSLINRNTRVFVFTT